MTEPISSIDLAQQRGHLKKCPDCDGWGERSIWTSNAGKPVVDLKCITCDGTGNVAVAEPS